MSHVMQFAFKQLKYIRGTDFLKLWQKMSLTTLCTCKFLILIFTKLVSSYSVRVLARTRAECRKYSFLQVESINLFHFLKGKLIL